MTDKTLDVVVVGNVGIDTIALFIAVDLSEAGRERFQLGGQSLHGALD